MFKDIIYVKNAFREIIITISCHLMEVKNYKTFTSGERPYVTCLHLMLLGQFYLKSTFSETLSNKKGGII